MKPHLLFVPVLLLFSFFAHAQQTRADSSQPVQIINALRGLIHKSDNNEIKILAGSVRLRQGNTLFFCDSCVLDPVTHMFEAFGNVHINDNDTTNIYSDYLRYLTDTKMAYLKGRVRLTDNHATLTTPDLTYDVNNKIGTYLNGGKLVNQKSTVTSREGVYYTDIKDFYFKKNVEVKDPANYLRADSLLYNTDTRKMTFIAETYIRDSSGRQIKTSSGEYDVANSRADFTSRTTITDKGIKATADRIASDNERGIIQMGGNAVVVDSVNKTTLIGGSIFRDTKNDKTLATIKPLMIIKQEEDSIYITADTLFTAKLTELYKYDSTMLRKLKLKEKDSTNRYFEAYRHVRVFSDSLQSVSDSLFYSFKDSTFHLYFDPVVWNKKSQITGDTIYLYTKNKKADRIKVFEHGFIVSELDPGVFNQVKSTRIDGFFKEGRLDSVRAKGLAESIYFLQDKDSSYTGVNQTKSDAIDMYFDKGELDKVVFRSGLKGTLNPVSQKQPSAMRLENFQWLIHRRPKTKYEMFE